MFTYYVDNVGLLIGALCFLCGNTVHQATGRPLSPLQSVLLIHKGSHLDQVEEENEVSKFTYKMVDKTEAIR